MEATHPAAVPGIDSLGVLRHRWWLIALAIVLGIIAAAGWLQSREPVWESTTSVLVHPVGRDANVVGGRTQNQVNLDTEAQLVRSTAVADEVAERLGPALGSEQGSELARQVQVAVPPNTSVLLVTYAAATPVGAQAGSRAFAEAYLHHREQAARADLTAQTETIQTRLNELDGRLAELTERLAANPPDTSAAVDLESQRDTVSGQLTALTERLDELATETVTAGTIINEPRLPSNPSWPPTPVVLASGAGLGLVAGVGAAAVSERLARRVRRPADLARRLGVPVLVTLTGATLPPNGIASPHDPAGRLFDRLRNEVLAGVAGRVIVVTSPTGGAATRLTAANLAASLSRSGDAVLVDTGSGPDSGATSPLARMLGIAAGPGLAEVLAGRADVTDALHQAPRYPRLSALTIGATATATGLLQSPALRNILTALAAQTGYVVVAAPATSDSADAQSLASHASAALLVVESRTRLAAAADAAAQLRQVGTPLLGVVVLQPKRRKPYPQRYGEPVRPAATPQPATDAPTVETRVGWPPAAELDGPTLVMPRVGGEPRPPGPRPDRRPAPSRGGAD